MTKCQHCDAEVLSTSQPNRRGTTAELDAIEALNAMLLIEHGLDVPMATRIADQWNRKCAELAEASAALAATPAEPQGTWSDGGKVWEGKPDGKAAWQRAENERMQKFSEEQAATPAVGGEDARTEALRVISTLAICEDGETAEERALIVDACREVATAALAATPAVGGLASELSNALREKSYWTYDDRALLSLVLAELVRSSRAPAVGGEREVLASEIAIAGHLRIEHGRLLSPSEKSLVVAALSAQPASPLRGREITDAMVEAGARIQATRRGHKNCDETITTTNKGKVPVWHFYTEEPREIFAAMLAASPPEQPAADPMTGRPCLGGRWGDIESGIKFGKESK